MTIEQELRSIKRLLTAKELSLYIRVTPKTLCKWASRGVIPGHQISADSSDWRFDPAKTADWLESTLHNGSTTLTPEQVAVALAMPDGTVMEQKDKSLRVAGGSTPGSENDQKNSEQ